MFKVHFDFDYNNMSEFLSFLSTTLANDFHNFKKIDLTPVGPAGGNPYVELTVPSMEMVKKIYDFYMGNDMTVMSIVGDSQKSDPFKEWVDTYVTTI